MTYATVRVERDGPVGWLVFDRPDAGNAMNARMFDDLEAAWRELGDDDAVRVIVNTGAGNAFQTGLDVAQLAQDRDALREQSRRTKHFELKFTSRDNDVWKPVIAAVNGVCAGGGLHFVADADIVLMSQTATLVDPHVSVGQATVYETIGLAKKSPMEPVLRLAFTGVHERMSAARAYELGICSQVEPPERLRDAAQKLAETIAQHPAEELATVKRALWNALEGTQRSPAGRSLQGRERE
ncbi:MAG: enoyl-CoA hydratase/isomerase family protein [Actinomycetota bacterium]|nr:enoyl-CoA hydratase/isomerase family protein [Actinomycetota bacterium]